MKHISKNRSEEAPSQDFCAIAASRDYRAVENWENEGGHFPGPGRDSGKGVAAVQVPRIGSVRLVAMRTSLMADFANGLVGQHYNTFQHRARILDQLTDAGRT